MYKILSDIHDNMFFRILDVMFYDWYTGDGNEPKSFSYRGLSSLTGIHWVTIRNLTNELLDKNILLEDTTYKYNRVYINLGNEVVLSLLSLWVFLYNDHLKNNNLLEINKTDINNNLDENIENH